MCAVLYRTSQFEVSKTLRLIQGLHSMIRGVGMRGMDYGGYGSVGAYLSSATNVVCYKRRLLDTSWGCVRDVCGPSSLL